MVVADGHPGCRPPRPTRRRSGPLATELVAELHGLSRVEQARHTIGVVTRAPALRAAVTAKDRVTLPGEDIVRKPISCKLHLHRWHTVSAEDGSGRFRRCRRCGKEDTNDGSANWFAGGTMA